MTHRAAVPQGGKMKKIILLALLLGTTSTFAKQSGHDYLVKVTPELQQSFSRLQVLTNREGSWQDLKIAGWFRLQMAESTHFKISSLKAQPGVLAVQPNYPIGLFKDPTKRPLTALTNIAAGTDNPAIPPTPVVRSGDDPLFSKQWGMNDIGARNGWQSAPSQKQMIVGVIDTGVDYTHEDLLPNMWRNPGESGLDANGVDRSSNGIDDDQNGYIDDVVGWDFVSNDNKPFDLKGNIFQGGNPGHGTHCAGNVAARGNNGMGISGVAPNAKIMALRFIGEKGQGSTATAIQAIKYAVDNGAQITSNSWGSEGEDPNYPEENQALRDAVTYAQNANVLFIAAAGNGHSGRGYNNDTDDRPAYPASYKHDNIISVAAIDINDEFGGFSNWGVNSVDIAAPGVKVYSTVVGGDYTDMVIPILKASWDGTSMAAPHVAGAAALYWSRNPEKSWQEVKSAIIASARKRPNMQGKLLSGGKLDVQALMKQ